MSRLDIANIALTQLGQDPITRLGSTEPNSKTMAGLIDQALRFTLAQHPWNEAISRAELPLADYKPPFGFPYAYKLPAGGELVECLRVIEATDALHGEIEWRREGRWLLSDAGGHTTDETNVDGPGPILLRYIGWVKDEAVWSPQLIQTTALYLASQTAFKITANRALGADKFKEFNDNLRVARSLDGQEMSRFPMYQDDLARSRL